MASSDSLDSIAEVERELQYLLNELRAFGTESEISADVNTIRMRLRRLSDYFDEVEYGQRRKSPIDVRRICREITSLPVQA